MSEQHPSLEICIQFSEDGKHIRKWSRFPFEGGECLYSHPKLIAAGEDQVERAWRDGWTECKNRLTEDEAFCLTEDVEEDAWLDSETRAAMADQCAESAKCPPREHLMSGWPVEE